jgi:peptidoglycan/LPS O-acetylase OafA/YrhL
VGEFILRRGFRIWPLYFFTFFCILLISIVIGHPGRQYGWTDLVFITNYYNRGIVEGSWSLCTEEQFYIVTPLALFWLATRGRSLSSYRPLLWGLVCAIPLLRAAIWIHGTGHFFKSDPALFAPLYYYSITHCDGLIVGLIIANLWVAKETRLLKIANPWVLFAMAICALGAVHAFQKEVFDFTGLALFFGSAVWLGIQRRIAIFNSRLFYWISRLSFGMYLNHEYFLPWLVHTVLPRVPLRIPLLSNLAGVLIMTLVSMAISFVTFCLVEFPFLEMRKKVLAHTQKNAAAPVMTAVSR